MCLMDRPQLAELGPELSVEWLVVRIGALPAAVERHHRADLRAGTETLRRLCSEYHDALLEALEAVLPVRMVLAEDEFAFRLVGQERTPVHARQLAARMRAAVEGVAAWLRCSIGIAPNRYLAGVAARQPSPDGLTLWLPAQLPEALYGLPLEQLPGMTGDLLSRLESLGVGSVQELSALDVTGLQQLWAGAEGERMWHWLRGSQYEPKVAERHTLGRQHVLSPELRTPDGAFAAAKNLLHEAAEELRELRLLAGSIGVAVNFLDDRQPRGQALALGAPSWSGEAHLQPCGDRFALQRQLARLWESCPRRPPILVYVWLSGLMPERAGRRAAAS